MIGTESWNRVQRGVTVAYLGMLTAFWFGLAMSFSQARALWAAFMGIGAYSAFRAYQGCRKDEADERAALIAMRAGYLSQRLMIGTSLLVLMVGDKLMGHPAATLLTVLVVGMAAETVFRRLQGETGNDEPAPAWAWVAAGIALMGFAGALLYTYQRVMGNLAEALLRP